VLTECLMARLSSTSQLESQLVARRIKNRIYYINQWKTIRTRDMFVMRDDIMTNPSTSTMANYIEQMVRILEHLKVATLDDTWHRREELNNSTLPRR